MTESPKSLFERKPLRRALANWMERHQTPFSFGIHLLGIPLAVTGFFWFCSALFGGDWSDWKWIAGLFFGGYFLQYIGHLYEGNTMGELIPLYRRLGWPYVAVAPQFQKKANDASNSASA